MKRLYLMITITNRVVGSGRFVDFYRAFGAPVVFTALGRGTASDDVLSYLGLEATEKAVLFSVVTPACKDTLVKELVSTMHLSAPGSGKRKAGNEGNGMALCKKSVIYRSDSSAYCGARHSEKEIRIHHA